MGNPQKFQAIDSTAADPSQPGTTTAAQVSTAHLQIARQNNRYLIEWRGPTLTFTWPNNLDPEEAETFYGFPRLAYATWACFGPFRYYVPDLSDDAISIVDVDLFCSVTVRDIRLAVFSLQGNRGQPPSSEWLDANSQIVTNGTSGRVTISGVKVRAGWNDIYIVEESPCDWNANLPTTLWTFTDNFGTYPRIIAFGGDLSADAPPLLNGNVPFVAVRAGTLMADKDAQFSATTPFTVAYSGVNSDGDGVDFIYLAEVTDLSQIPTSCGLNDYGRGVFYWAEMGVLELYSLSITPYASHPDKVNDPMLRWYQLTGSNVADIYWQASRLNDLRQTQVGSAKSPEQELITWPGSWRIELFDDVARIALVRDVALTVLTEQPTEAAGDVSIEVSLPAMLLDPAEFRPDAYQPPSGFLDVIIELFDLTSGVVVETATLPSVNITPRLSLARTIDATPSSFYWLRKMWEQRSEVAWHLQAPNGQPWSHDMTVSLASASSTMTPITARLPLSTATWASLRTSGHIYSVRVSFSDNLSGSTGAILAVGPLTARIDWGRR